MRLIDADALKEKVWDADTSCGYVQVVDVGDIDDAPTIETERKTGKWLCSDDLYATAVCSCCGWDTTAPWQHIKSWFEFCPHCGADMRGENDGSD